MQLGAIINKPDMVKNKQLNVSQNRRETTQRQLIFKILERTAQHLTAAQLYQIVKKDLPKISFATVYRNLRILLEQEKISCLIFSTDQALYESRVDEHYHLICQACDKITHVELSELINLNHQVSRRYNWRIDNHRLNFFGRCKECLK